MKWSGLIVFIIEISLFITVHNAYAQLSNAVKTVAIDPGHGGKDPGAVGFGLKEKDITLSVALKLGKLIKTYFPDIKMVYTRSTDEFIELFRRAQIANQAKADLFISIHVNSNKKSDPFGAETYVMGLSKSEANLDVAMTENAVILKEEDYKKQYDGFDPHSPEAYIIFSLYQNAFLDLSLNFSSIIQQEYTKIKRINRGVKQAGFLVLWKTTMPSVLTEIGFISNAEDASYLGNEKNHWYIAMSLFNALSKYKGQIENKTYIELNDNDIQKYIKNSHFLKDTTKQLPIVKDTSSVVINSEDSLKPNTFQQAMQQLINHQSSDSIFFYVQIASSDKKITQFKVDNVEELYVDHCYKYVCAKTTIYSQVIEKQKEIKKFYPDAFIIALKNGKKIPLGEAIKQTKN